jgi:chaperonin cofactor prefoldin
MSTHYAESATAQTQSQLSYIATQAAEIEQQLGRLQSLKHELRGIVIQCDPMAFPP